MNCSQDRYDDSIESFNVQYVPDHCKKSKRPVLCSCDDVKRIVEESCRARLISQVVGDPESHLTKDFASSYKCARGNGPPQFSTSYKIRPDTRRKETVPTYQSLVQSLRWSPYVEISSAENSQTNMNEKPKFKCRCRSCVVDKCPSRSSSTSTIKPVVFKDNIMTFSDRYTMTPRLNDVCCGVCTPMPTVSKTSDVCVSADVAVRDTETITYFPMCNQKCHPIPILKRPDGQPANYGYCGHTAGHVSEEIRQEAVRDTDEGEDYCEPIKPKSLKAFFKPKHRPVVEAEPPFIPEYRRRIIYNEGISDSVATNCPMPPIRVPSPVNVQRGSSRVSVRSKTRDIDFYDPIPIPYSHRTESKYHHSCKEQNLKPFYCSDMDEVRHVVESPKVIKKILPCRPIKHNRAFPITLPKKVLTSEPNIDSYIDKGLSDNTKERKWHKKIWK